MIEERYRVLIHRAVDGELNERERADLDGYLTTSPDARQFYEQVEQLSSLPTLISPVNPPAGSKNEILAAIDHARYRRTAQKPNRASSWKSPLVVFWSPRLIYAVSAGLVLGVAIGALTFRGANTGDLNPLELSATVLGRQDSSHLKRVDADAFSTGQASGRLAVDVGNKLTYVQMEIESSQEVTVAIDFDPVEYVFRAYEQQRPTVNSVMTSEGLVRAAHIGQNRYLFVFSRDTEGTKPIVCRVESTGEIYSREIRTE